MGGRKRPLSIGTTPHKSRPSSVSVPVLSKQTQFNEPGCLKTTKFETRIQPERWILLPETLMDLGEMQKMLRSFNLF